MAAVRVIVVTLALAYALASNYYTTRCYDHNGDRAELTVRGVYCVAVRPERTYHKLLRELEKPEPVSGEKGL